MKKPLAIFDLDGTVRNTFSFVYPRADQVILFPGIQERLLEIKRLGYIIVGVTNQGGVSKGEITNAEVSSANERTQDLLGQAKFEKIYYCPHHGPTDGRNCDCKKPAPGLIIDALTEVENSTLEGAFVVGDDVETDGGLAACLDLPFIPAKQFRASAVGDLQLLIEAHRKRANRVVPPNDKVAGTLVGLAVGDALGAALEFIPRAEVKARYPQGLRDFVASHMWARGEYTDDTAMALLIALAYADNDLPRVQFDFRRWAKVRQYKHANFPTIACKDIGISTAAILGACGDERTAREYYETHPKGAAGNGALMRCCPIALYNVHSLPMLIAESRRVARMTHADPKAQSSCVILNVWLRAILRSGVKDARKEAVALLPNTERKPWNRLLSIESCTKDEIDSGGYAVSTLEAAAWCFLKTSSFEDAVITAANLGDDADTVAAVTGALAGAYYGWDAIPSRWRKDLMHSESIRDLALQIACDANCSF